MHKGFALLLTGLLAILVAGCKEKEAQKSDTGLQKPATEVAPPATAPETAEAAAVAVLRPTEGNSVTGTVTFNRTPEGIEVVADLQGLTPGQHGFHVHETGDCSAPDASSAGGHYNPDGAPHGAPDNPQGQRHLGDLGNLEAGADGTASYRGTDRMIALEGGNSIVGKALVVHSGPDDFSSQPAGDSGSRVACGVIEPTTRDDREPRKEK